MDNKDAAPGSPPPQSPITSRIAGSLSLIYAAVGSLWILFSDRAVRMMSSDPDVLMRLQMFKGWLFVGATTIMLYFMLRRHVRQISAATSTLAESEMKYRQFFESNPHPMWVFDRATLEFLAVNDAAVSHYGYDRSEFLSMTLKDIRPPEDVAALMEVLAKPIFGHRKEGVWRHLTKNGDIILVEISTHDLLFEGRVAELVLAHDVTEQIRNQRLLQEQKRILKDIASNNPLEESLDELITFMEKESGSAMCSILLLDPETRTLRWGAAPSLPTDYNRFVDGLTPGPCNGSCGTAVFRRERVVVSDIASDPLWEASRETALSYGLRACTSQPIFGADGEVLGTFAFYYRTPRAPSEYDFRLIEASSAIAGIAIERHRSEQSLQESEEKYRLLFEAESDAIVVFDQETHRILEVNNAALALYGYSRAEWLSFRCEDVSAEPTSTSEAVEIASEQTFQRIPLRWHRKKDGTIFPVEISAATYMYRGRKLICSAHRDITDRKRSEEMLRNVAEGVSAATGDNFFRLLAEYLARSLNFDYVLLGEVTGDGTQVLTLANYARGRFIANIVYDLAHTPCEHVVRGSLCSYPENVRNLFPQDTMLDDLDIESYVGTPLYDSAGNTLGLMAVMDSKPITDRDTAETMLRIFAARASAELERKRWETELRENQELLSTVLDSLPVAVWILDAEGNIKRTNPAGLEIWGGVKYVGVDKFGEYRGWWADTGKPLAPEDWGGFRAVRRGETSLDEVVDIETLDGKRKTILHSAVPITTDTGRIIGAVVVNQDITERRRLEEQLRHSQKMEAVGTLTGGIAHDFNNILTAIIGYCSILRMKMPLGDPLLVFIDNLAASAERASDLTRSLLAFSRKQILTPQPVDLNGIVSSTEKLLVRLIGEHIEIKTALLPDPLIINADRGQIEQILMNLATNARDAMPDGGMLYLNTQVVELDEEFRRIHGFGDPGRYACLSVSDTGGGMSDSTRKRIFEPFYTTKEVGKGTGLGLSIVYGIVKQHKGYINVYSEVGAGTGINIYLPLVDAEPKVDESAPTHRMLCGNETLLLAEDNEEVRRLTRLVLEEFGYSVIESMDGVEAVERFAEYQEGINLLILDVIMPRKNGRDALEDIRKIRPDVPVVFTSGYPIDIISSREIFDEGQVFVPKPVLPHVLLSRIREALDGAVKR